MKKNNKMIAEFIGWTFTKREDGNYDLRKDGVESWEIGTDADFKSGATYSGSFSYSEWNDIMPVVDRIESLGYSYDRVNADVFINDQEGENIIPNPMDCNNMTMIQKTHFIVVEFIKFYNQNK